MRDHGKFGNATNRAAPRWDTQSEDTAAGAMSAAVSDLLWRVDSAMDEAVRDAIARGFSAEHMWIEEDRFGPRMERRLMFGPEGQRSDADLRMVVASVVIDDGMGDRATARSRAIAHAVREAENAVIEAAAREEG